MLIRIQINLKMPIIEIIQVLLELQYNGRIAEESCWAGWSPVLATVHNQMLKTHQFDCQNIKLEIEHLYQ